MKDRTQGAKFVDPKFEIEVQKTSSGFVDDITYIINSFIRSLENDETLQDVAQQTSTAAQWWEELLYATGGKLEL